MNAAVALENAAAIEHSAASMEQLHGYRFAIHFAPDLPTLIADEPPPLGMGSGPSPVQLLAASVGNCLADSLLFALKKFGQSPEPIRAHVHSSVGRNASNRLRVQRIRVELVLGVPAAQLRHLDRALAQFEDFCTVTGSIRQAFPVEVEVRDNLGERLK